MRGMRIRNPHFWVKNGLGSSIRLGMRIGNPHFWAKKRGAAMETSTNMQKCDEMLRKVGEH